MASFDIHNTLFTGKILYYESEMSSTNDFARNLLSKTKPIDGTVIITDAQTKGKGQGNNKWLTKPTENLTFSIIFDTSFLRAKDQFLFSSAIAIGVCKGLEMLQGSKEVKIKWPNDIFCDEKKIGGILIENSIVGQFLKYSIAGIGININQSSFENLPFATSLKNIYNKTFDLNEFLNSICQQIEIQFLKLSRGENKKLLEHFNRKLFKKDRTVKIEMNKEIITAIVKEVNAFGQLGLQLNDKVKYFNHGQIKWLLE